MGLWADHFHPRVWLRWDFLGWIIAALIAVAGIFLFFEQYLIANFCFVAVAGFLFVKFITVAVFSRGKMFASVVFAFVICGLVGAGITAALISVNRFRDSKAAERSNPPPASSAVIQPAPMGSPSDASAKVQPLPNTPQPPASRTLREPPIERTAKFTVMVPFDTAPNVFPIPMDDNPDDPLFNTYMEFHSLAMNGTMPQATREAAGNSRVEWNSRPISMEEAPAFLGRLLQYYIFQSIDNLQRDSMTVYVGYPAEATAGIEPPDAEVYPYEKLANELADNVFFRPFLNRSSGDEMKWKVKPAKFPKGMEIQFETEKPDRNLVRFTRPGYFRADFIVQQFLGTGVGQVPRHFASKSASTIMQWAFVVTMHYRIERPADDSFNPGDYAQWLDALFDGLRRRLEIDPSEKRSR